ncbi:hypothetical protein Cgig2_028477 [Carnegiea gigantea]|uniref:Uncharacterized protein n=1 Tax=Carnegiea gigantea TaxID=171969 RepID=A0A9Q1K817_9CARY|nr:hypothetical protein Cgig2_028477 [Carnegiea gigantea]
MGTSNTTHAGDEQSYLRSSNIVSRMKKVPRLRKPSRVRGSPYTNPMHETKGGRKGLKSTATVKMGSGHRSPSTVRGDVVNDEDVISVVPIAIVPGEGEVDAYAVPNAALKDDVPDTSTFSPSPHVPAPCTRGTGSKFVICEEVSFVNPLFGFRFRQGEGVKVYLTWTFSPMELDLLAAVRAWCKGVKDNQWNFDLLEASEKHANAEFLKGLINVVPTRGAADRPGRYCIGLQLSTVNGGYVTFLQGLLSKPEHAARDIWETLKAQQDSNLRYVRLTSSTSVSLMCARLVTNYFLAFSRGALLTSHKPSCRVRKWRFGEGGLTLESPRMYIK